MQNILGKITVKYVDVFKTKHETTSKITKFKHQLQNRVNSLKEESVHFMFQFF